MLKDKKDKKDKKKKKKKKIVVETVDEDSDDEDSSDGDDESYSNESVESSGSDTTASKDKRSTKEIYKETMAQLSSQRANHKKKAQNKVKKDWKRAGFKKLSEDQLVEGFTSAVNSAELCRCGRS